MISMRVHQIIMDSINEKYTLILQDSSTVHRLNIPLGNGEAKLLTFMLTSNSLPFPLMHEILIETLSICEGTIKSITIDDFINNTFITHIMIEHTTKQVCFACKPSEAILVALKNKMPIKVSEHIVKEFSSQEKQQNIRPDDINIAMQHSPINSLWNKALNEINNTKTSTHVISKSQHPRGDDEKMLDLLIKLNPTSTRKM